MPNLRKILKEVQELPGDFMNNGPVKQLSAFLMAYDPVHVELMEDYIEAVKLMNGLHSCNRRVALDNFQKKAQALDTYRREHDYETNGIH